MAKKTKNIPTSVLGRSTRLLSTGASLLSREVAHRIGSAFSSERLEESVLGKQLGQTRELVSALSQLRGAAMKAGQMLSIEFSDLLPKEVVAILRELHSDAKPMPFATVERVLKKEWGAERYGKIEDLSREPVASASIGQVHRAVIDGESVAVKIQIPGVDKTIDSDLALLRKIANTLLRIYGKTVQLDGVFAEIKRSLKSEIDYRQEARAAELYSEAFQNDARFVVPRVFNDWSTRHVLTLGFVEGVKIDSWLKSAPETHELNQFAALVLDLLVQEFFVAGLVQTDPNYGNFLYRPLEQRLVLLDFGATQKYSKKFRRDYLLLIKEVLAGNDAHVLAMAYRLELIDERESAAVKAQFVDLLYLLMSMFSPDNQPFCFEDTAYLNEVRKVLIDFAKAAKFTAPPKNLIFLNRKLGGMYHLLRDVGVKVDLAAILVRIEALVI